MSAELRSIKFTQFMRPNGHPVAVYWSPRVPVDDSVFEMAYELMRRGAVFEIEMLTTGEISMECGFPDDESPLSSVICEDGPNVHESVQTLIRHAHARLS